MDFIGAGNQNQRRFCADLSPLVWTSAAYSASNALSFRPRTMTLQRPRKSMWRRFIESIAVLCNW